MKHNTKEFKDLQAVWDKKLVASGFEDIEQRDGRLKKSSNTKFGASSETAMAAKEEYFRVAGHFLFDYRFANAVERRIWELHCQGEGRPRIVAALRAEKLWFEQGYNGRRWKRPCSYSVQQILERLGAEMMKKLKNERQNRQE